MKTVFALFASLLWATQAFAAPPLLSPAELQPLLGNPAVRVIDIRDPKSYAAAHIPGAVNAPYGSWRGPASSPGELPELAKLTAQVQRLGLTPATRAVVVSSGADATDFGAAARVYWTLKVLGLKELSVLNGGVKAWASAGLPQDANPVSVAASSFQPVLDRSMIATRDEVAQAIERNNATLIDARPADFFNGQTRHAAARSAGTLKGAVNLEHASWFAPGSSSFVSVDEARRVATALKIDPQRDSLSFCNTGHWAATNWFALSEVLGQPQVKLYAGSMVDWTSAPQALPMDNAPGRVGQLMVDFKIWAARTFN
jgi:thiosulfate/3-mercaptopyruvate sulfurtransferase